LYRERKDNGRSEEKQLGERPGFPEKVRAQI